MSMKFPAISIPNTNLTHCEQMGYELEKYGANTTNCDHRIFMTVAGKEAWAKGKKKALTEKANARRN